MRLGWLASSHANTLNCSGLTRGIILISLIEHAVSGQPGQATLNRETLKLIAAELNNQKRLEVVHGFYIGMDFSTFPILNYEAFNREYGKNEFQKIIWRLRKEQQLSEEL